MPHYERLGAIRDIATTAPMSTAHSDRTRARRQTTYVSALRLPGALLMEQHDQWTTGHHYLDMTAYWQWRQARHEHQPVREVTMQTA